MVALPFRRFPNLRGDPNNPMRLLELELLLRLPLFLLSRSSIAPEFVNASGPPPPTPVVAEAVLASTSTADRFMLQGPFVVLSLRRLP